MPTIAVVGAALVLALLTLLQLRAARTAESRPLAWWRSVEVALEGPVLPVACGVIAAAVTWRIWGSLDAAPVFHDEMSYLLQARLFAAGRWVAPAAPIPAFFEQYHVLLAPVIASKYPPGHALLLAPGVWLGLPGLMPVLLAGVAGALVFALARRITNGWIALLTFVLWLVSWDGLRFRPTYMSEVTTTALWLAGWWALLEWRRTGKRAWLLALAACVGWGAITRPLTMLVYALPIGVVVVVMVARTRRWRDLAAAMMVGSAVLAILPIWNASTTGDWRRSSWAAYAAEYMPWDRMGFGLDTTPPSQPVSADMTHFAGTFRADHAGYTPARLPIALSDRAVALYESALWGAHWLLPFALVGIMLLALGAAGAEGRVALASALLLLGAYLVYSHVVSWSIYYLEAAYLLPFATALGIWAVASALPALVRRRRPVGMLRPASRLFAVPATIAVLIVLLPAGVARVGASARRQAMQQAYQSEWRAVTSRIPSARAILFIRYAPTHDPHMTLVDNDGDLERARIWFVHDRGAENAKLLAIAPDRVPYLFDEASGVIRQLPPGGLAVASERAAH